VGPRNRKEPIGRCGSRPAHGVGHGDQRLVLADHAPPQPLFHAQQLVALAFQHLLDRHAGPARDDGGDLLGVDGLRRHAVGLSGLGVGELALDLGDLAVLDLARLGEVARALGPDQVGAQPVERLAQLGGGDQLLLLRAPAGGHFGRLRLQRRDVVLEFLEPCAGRGIGLLPQRLALDLELDQAPVDLVERLGLAVHRHAHTARRLVDEVDRLVRQEAVGDVAVGQGPPPSAR
jgi:hypothetical protein